MSRTRVLVVDDSAVFRRMVVHELSADPALEVVGTAANGRIAVAKLPQLAPDLVVLDVEMPELDGLATLREIRKTHPRLPVVMFSALTERGAEATLDALALGATSYFTKPHTNGLDESLTVIRTGLIPEIKAICARGPVVAGSSAIRRLAAPGSQLSRPPVPFGAPPSGIRSLSAGRVDVVAVGTSTGGPNALTDVFESLPPDLPVPVLIVQHMPPTFTRLLAERLTARGTLRADEARSGTALAPGRAWIAPGDFHLTVSGTAADTRLSLNQDAPENSCRPAADVLFRSIARVFGPNALAVVMTGMGQDGFRGCEAVKEAGGQVIVQDEATSVVWGMPGFVARAGLADRVLPLVQIGPEIVRRVRLGRGDAR